MRILFKIAVILFAFLIIHTDSSAQSSVLNTGQWSKFSVANDGVFKITYDLLRASGFNPDQVDPRKIKLYTGLNGMLPQANSITRPVDLIEMAIFISGEADGKFGREDYILFYGKGPDTYSFNTTKGTFNYENNLYSDKNFYFITVAPDNGKRIMGLADLGSGFPVITEFDDLVFYEKETYNILKSGREWVGEQFDVSTEARLGFSLSGILENSSIKVVSHVMAQSFNGSSFRIFYNNVQIAEQFVAAIPNTQYGIKGQYRADTITINSSGVSAFSRDNQEIKYQYVKDPSGTSIGFLDYFLISFKRRLSLYNNSTLFVSSKSLTNAVSTFTVGNMTPSNFIWDVSNPVDPANQSFTTTETISSFSTNTSVLKTFIAFTPSAMPAPDFEGAVINQNLHGITQADLIIIAHPDFLAEAARLAHHRNSHNQISVRVVTPNQVYNEYSSGKQDVSAIRDFARDVYNRSGKQLKNLLLFGRGSYDYRNRVFNNTNFIPTYESRNSLDPLGTYSSDDYYGFLEIAEGSWNENPAENHTLDIGVGRLSVKKPEEAQHVVDKLIDYDINPDAKGKWRSDILFVADDGDFNLHQDQAEQIAESLDQNHPEFTIRKVYVDAYTQITKPSGQTSPSAREALEEALRNGSLIVNYTGHGSERVWMDERILDAETITTWANKNKYPLLVTATCEFGRHDDPALISTSELALIKKQGGAIGLVTTSRPVYSGSNFTLNQAFYAALFKKENGKYRDLGSIFRETKNTSISGVGNRNFSLLGDPSMQLAIPELQIAIDELKTSSFSDTLKALSHVMAKGKIMNAGIPEINFAGTLDATLFDQEASLKTLGDENAVYTYQLWNNAVFRGQASVKDGLFQFDFIVPKNIAEQIGKGKLNLYAHSKTSGASGAFLNFPVGQAEAITGNDLVAPDIKLFMGDTTFLNGGITGPDTKLIAKLSDQSGINISSFGSQNRSITATLDDDKIYTINQYYKSEINDYKHGSISFPMIGLEEGRHSLTLNVWDTYNNPASSKIEFVVTNGTTLEIQEFFNYPNPFSTTTEILFSHNRQGEDLEAFLSFYSMTGQIMNKFFYTIPASPSRVKLTEWDATSIDGTKLVPGVYVMKVLVRSLLDGSKNEQITKLIILN